MKQKQILVILIVIILAIIACLTAYMLVNSHDENYTTLRISNSCTIDVPNENNTVERINGNITKFSFNSSNLTILHEKSGKNNELKSMNTKIIKNSEQTENNIHRDKSSGLYSTFIENKNTGDALLITSNDLNQLKKVANSVKFSKPLNTNIFKNNNNNTTADDNATTSILDLFQNTGQSQQSSNQPNSNNNPTPTPTPEPTPTPTPAPDSGSDDGSKQDDGSKYPSFIPG